MPPKSFASRSGTNFQAWGQDVSDSPDPPPFFSQQPSHLPLPTPSMPQTQRTFVPNQWKSPSDRHARPAAAGASFHPRPPLLPNPTPGSAILPTPPPNLMRARAAPPLLLSPFDPIPPRPTKHHSRPPQPDFSQRGREKVPRFVEHADWVPPPRPPIVQPQGGVENFARPPPPSTMKGGVIPAYEFSTQRDKAVNTSARHQRRGGREIPQKRPQLALSDFPGAQPFFENSQIPPPEQCFFQPPPRPQPQPRRSFVSRKNEFFGLSEGDPDFAHSDFQSGQMQDASSWRFFDQRPPSPPNLGFGERERAASPVGEHQPKTWERLECGAKQIIYLSTEEERRLFGEPSTAISCEGIPERVSDDDVISRFSQFGDVTKLTRLFNSALIHFASPCQAREAMYYMHDTRTKFGSKQTTQVKPPRRLVVKFISAEDQTPLKSLKLEHFREYLTRKMAFLVYFDFENWKESRQKFGMKIEESKFQIDCSKPTHDTWQTMRSQFASCIFNALKPFQKGHWDTEAISFKILVHMFIQSDWFYPTCSDPEFSLEFSDWFLEIQGKSEMVFSDIFQRDLRYFGFCAAVNGVCDERCFRARFEKMMEIMCEWKAKEMSGIVVPQHEDVSAWGRFYTDPCFVHPAASAFTTETTGLPQKGVEYLCSIINSPPGLQMWQDRRTTAIFIGMCAILGLFPNSLPSIALTNPRQFPEVAECRQRAYQQFKQDWSARFPDIFNQVIEQLWKRHLILTGT